MRFFRVRSPTEGLRVIEHPVITRNYRESLRVRRRARVAVLLPCAATKPFPRAPSHASGYLEALEGLDVDLYVVSEPLGVIPYEWSTTYPNDAYDFPPRHLTGEARDVLVQRIAGWLHFVGRKYDRIVAALPGHHMALVRDADQGIGLPMVEAGVSACRRAACNAQTFRATSHAYKRWLRSTVQRTLRATRR